MNKNRLIEYIVVFGVWMAFVYLVIQPLILEHFMSVTVFILLTPMVVYWVLRERLLVWDNSDPNDR